MRIVVTGGTGFIGREVVKGLLLVGEDDIAVTSRNPERADLWGGRVEIIQAFAGDAITLGRAFTRADVVVHSIQFPNHPVEIPSRGRTYMEIDAKGTEVAARTAKKVGVRRFVYLSGAGAGQNRPEPWFRAKDHAEAAIRETGMEYALIRPSWIYGPEDRSMNRFVFFCRNLPVIPVIGDGKTAVHPVYVGDVASAVGELIRREDAKQVILELGGPERLTMNEIIRIIQKVLGTNRHSLARSIQDLLGPHALLHHPTWLMKWLVLPMRLLPEPPLSASAIDFITQEVAFDPEPAMEFLGARFKRLEEGLRQYLP